MNLMTYKIARILLWLCFRSHINCHLFSDTSLWDKLLYWLLTYRSRHARHPPLQTSNIAFKTRCHDVESMNTDSCIKFFFHFREIMHFTGPVKCMISQFWQQKKLTNCILIQLTSYLNKKIHIFWQRCRLLTWLGWLIQRKCLLRCKKMESTMESSCFIYV